MPKLTSSCTVAFFVFQRPSIGDVPAAEPAAASAIVPSATRIVEQIRRLIVSRLSGGITRRESTV
jgi:hypothetical protein